MELRLVEFPVPISFDSNHATVDIDSNFVTFDLNDEVMTCDHIDSCTCIQQ